MYIYIHIYILYIIYIIYILYILYIIYNVPFCFPRIESDDAASLNSIMYILYTYTYIYIVMDVYCSVSPSSKNMENQSLRYNVIVSLCLH